MSDRPHRYVVGAASPQRDATASFEFKAPDPDRTGGGYPRWRAWEYRPETPGDRKEDVYVAVHRLAAVAWLLPDGTLGEDVHLAELDGVDVHHELGMPAANVEDELALVEHGTHSEVTQAQMRAWGEDAKRTVADDGPADEERCEHCGAAADVRCRSPDWDGAVCMGCAQRLSEDAPIEVL